jgi:hypothetical protein
MPNIWNFTRNFTTNIVHETCLVHDLEINANVY